MRDPDVWVAPSRGGRHASSQDPYPITTAVWTPSPTKQLQTPQVAVPPPLLRKLPEARVLFGSSGERASLLQAVSLLGERGLSVLVGPMESSKSVTAY